MTNVVIFSENPSHIEFAKFVAKNLNKPLIKELDISKISTSNLNLVPDFLSHAAGVCENCIILETATDIIPKFSTLVSNIETSDPQDFKIFLFHLNLLEFTNSQIMILNRSEDKYQVLNFFKKIFKENDTNSQVMADILQVIDETLMNAIFDAADLNIPRDSHFKMDKEVVIEWALEGDMFFFKVVDQWGSLDKQKVVDHLNRDLSSYNFDPNYHGAGLGLYHSFHVAGATMKFECIKNKRTTVSCLFSIKKKNRDFKKQLKFFSVA